VRGPGLAERRQLEQRGRPMTEAAQDAQAMADVTTLERYLAACRRRSGTYVGCDSPGNRGLIRTGVPRAAAELSGLTFESFSIKAHSRSGTVFILTRTPDGRLARYCQPPGKGACPKNERW